MPLWYVRKAHYNRLNVDQGINFDSLGQEGVSMGPELSQGERTYPNGWTKAEYESYLATRRESLEIAEQYFFLQANNPDWYIEL